MPHDQKNKTKEKQYCNKFNKNFKNGPHKKIFKYLFNKINKYINL